MESNFWKNLMLKIGQECPNVRIFRNNVGLGWVGKVVKHSAKEIILEYPRPLRAGLMPGSGDGIGYTTITITPEMVGKKLAVFTSIETKSSKGDIRDQQITWAKNVQNAGGIALVLREGESFDLEILKNYKP
jgi:ribosomal protein S19